MPVIKAGWYHHNSGKHPGNHFCQSGVQFGIKLNFSPTIVREEIIPPDDPSCDYKPTFLASSRFVHLAFPNGDSTLDYISSSSYTVLVIKVKYAKIADTVAASILARGLPAQVVLLPSINLENYQCQGNQKVIANLLSDENVLVVRPDYVIAWRIDESSIPHGPQVEEGVSKITGLDYNGGCLRDLYQSSNDAKTTKSYQSWLTREFRYNQRPYKFRFPMAGEFLYDHVCTYIFLQYSLAYHRLNSDC